MKSKSYILMQIQNLLINRHDYSENRASKYIEEIKEKTVYELLTLKKELTESEEVYPDVSHRRSIWGHRRTEDD